MKRLMMRKVAIDIGCGEEKQPNHIGLDLRRTEAVDIIADARCLPFKTESIDVVYSSHTLEHFGHMEVKEVLCEWVRVLKQHGQIDLSCPDLRLRSLLFFLNPSWKNIVNIYGGQDYKHNFHKCGFSFGLLKSLLEESGIGEVKRVISGYKGIPFLPNNLHVRGRKK